ncbi:MAG: hypothetical protein A2Y14_03230 [Verrucomicrobia bacterium GWF2_51_19]|nr:MAG: hypothetical protein A2Y14_03230 [Verrucomicrobia bacterium GWF2_51_19]HCJ12379.1 hypothetical protein [Opitutae bacterium]
MKKLILLLAVSFGSLLANQDADERFLAAVRAGDLETAKDLVGQGVEPSELPIEKLFQGYELISLEMGKLLLENGVDADAFNRLVLAKSSAKAFDGQGLPSWHEVFLRQTRKPFVRQRNELIALGLSHGASPNELLSNVLTQVVDIDGYDSQKSFNVMDIVAPMSLVKMADRFGANVSEIELQHFTGELPSFELASYVLNKGLNPTMFIKAIERCWNVTSINQLNSAKIEKKEALIELALAKGADVSKINCGILWTPGCVPSDDLVDAMLNAGVNPSKLFFEILAITDITGGPDFTRRQNDLLKNLKDKGFVELEHIPIGVSAIRDVRDGKTFFDYDQIIRLKRLGQILEERGSLTLAERMKTSLGHCMGLTTYWLLNPSNLDPFLSPTIFSSPKDLSKDQLDRFERFAEVIDFLQQPFQYVPGLKQIDIEAVWREAIQRGLLPKEVGDLTIKYKTVFAVKTAEESMDLFKRILHEGELMYLVSVGHVVGVLLKEGVWYFYDSSANIGILTFREPNDVLTYLRESFDIAEDVDESWRYRGRGVVVVGPSSVQNQYNVPEKYLLQNIQVDQIGPKPLKEIIQISYHIYGMQSMDQFPGLVKDDSFKATFLIVATTVNDCETVKALLQKGFDPNAVWTTDTYPKVEASPLQTASKIGSIECVRVLCDDPRTDINKADGFTGWTALMYAAATNRPEIIRLLLEKGADKSLKNKDGQTALDLAKKSGASEDLLDLLMD